MTIPRFSIVLTHNRPELLKQCVAAISTQADFVVIIDNASDPPVTRRDFPPSVKLMAIINEPLQPPNLSTFWNIGFNYINHLHLAPQWDVAVLCDDVVVPDGWFETVSIGMRANGAAAASTHQWYEVPTPILKNAPDNDLTNRMCGWAYVVAGEKNLRADEDLHWWWCDTDMDWQARNNGGMVIVPGPVAKNIHPNDWTYRVPGLAEQTGTDGQTFARKWGSRPW